MLKNRENENDPLRRLLAIDWASPGDGRNSHVALMREYLRCAAQWANRLHVVEQWPFFDVAAIVAPEVRADQSLVAQVESALTPHGLWPTVKKTCIWHLHWEELKRVQPEFFAQHKLDEPFEPLVRFYERGGRFYTEHGFINIDAIGIPAKVRGWHAYCSPAPVVALDDGTLDHLDVIGKTIS